MILCSGESLIDMLPRQSEAGEAAFAPYPGGAVFNTAIALGRLGRPTGFLSGISTDLFGSLLTESLGAARVSSDLAIRSDRPTTLAFVTLAEGQARYAFYDEGTAGRMLSPDDMPLLPDSIGALFCGGISLMAEPCGAAYEALFLRNAAQCVTMIDPNIRPGFIRDQEAYRARIGRMIAAADIVKLSDEDLHWLAGESDGDLATLAAQILQQGPAAVFVTEGAQGAHAFTRTETVSRPGLRVRVADTVGAGDTFNAGILASLSQADLLNKQAVRALSAEDLAAAIDLGNRAASVTVSRPGANPPWWHELPAAEVA